MFSCLLKFLLDFQQHFTLSALIGSVTDCRQWLRMRRQAMKNTIEVLVRVVRWLQRRALTKKTICQLNESILYTQPHIGDEERGGWFSCVGCMVCNVRVPLSSPSLEVALEMDPALPP